MTLPWIPFLLLQTAVLAVFWLLRKRKQEHPLAWLAPTRLHVSVMNAAMLLSCHLLNVNHQLFCRPVPWAAGVLVVWCVAFVLSPLVAGRPGWGAVLLPVVGMGWFLVLYALLFAGKPYLLLALLLSPLAAGLLVLQHVRHGTWAALTLWLWMWMTPFVVLAQMVTLWRSHTPRWQRALLTLPSTALVVWSFWVALQMWPVAQRLQQHAYSPASVAAAVKTPQQLRHAELILGAHWKYHTELCLYDGWRPPYHDPRVVVAKWLLYPDRAFGLDAERDRLQGMYAALFPEAPLSFDCQCGKKELLLE